MCNVHLKGFANKVVFITAICSVLHPPQHDCQVLALSRNDSISKSLSPYEILVLFPENLGVLHLFSEEGDTRGVLRSDPDNLALTPHLLLPLAHSCQLLAKPLQLLHPLPHQLSVLFRQLVVPASLMNSCSTYFLCLCVQLPFQRSLIKLDVLPEPYPEPFPVDETRFDHFLPFQNPSFS